MLLRGMTASAEALDNDLLGEVGPAILLLLVAIVNVGAVFLALELTRRQELTVRVALGAIAALFSGWLESILYGVRSHEPATIAGVALLVCRVTAVATYIPARRAASIEPTEALRE